MKKLISIMSALAIALSMLTPAVFADNDDNKMQSVLESVKKRVDIPEECTEFSSGTQTIHGITTYEFEWRNGDKGSEYKYIDIYCQENGVITSYAVRGNSTYSESPGIPTVSKESAKQNAEEFIKKLNPDFPHEIRIEDNRYNSLYNKEYEFITQVYVNGIRLDDLSGEIRVNGTTGEVIYCNIVYLPAEFPSLENIIDIDEAKKAYSEKLGLEMVYRAYTDEDGKDIAYPVYTQKYYDRYINAVTSEIVNMNEHTGQNNKMYSQGTGENAEARDDAGLSPQEIKELEQVNSLISKENMEKYLRENKTLNIPESVTVSHIRLSKSHDKNEYTYVINMSDNKNDTYIYICADAKTGEILRYNRYGDKDAELKRDDKAFKALAGDKSAEYTYNEENHNYERYVNGLRVDADNARMAFSSDVLTEYSISYTNTEFPSTDGAINVSDAEKVMFEKDGYEPVYAFRELENGFEYVPIYKHKRVNINPFTGKYVDYNNEEVTDNGKNVEYSDISGHYAEKYIKELAYYGIGFEGKEFKPDEKITRKEFFELLNKVWRGNPNSRLTEEEDENSAVTREAAAVYMIWAMGAEEYAKYNDIYVSPFKDVTENKGCVALLAAMGVVGGDENGKFNPKREITRAESAVMLYKYLTR